jgi:hypothetical protein
MVVNSGRQREGKGGREAREVKRDLEEAENESRE